MYSISWLLIYTRWPEWRVSRYDKNLHGYNFVERVGTDKNNRVKTDLESMSLHVTNSPIDCSHSS